MQRSHFHVLAFIVMTQVALSDVTLRPLGPKDEPIEGAKVYTWKSGTCSLKDGELKVLLETDNTQDGKLDLKIQNFEAEMIFTDEHSRAWTIQPETHEKSHCAVRLDKMLFKGKAMTQVEISLKCQYLYRAGANAGFTKHFEIAPGNAILCSDFN